MIKFRNHIGTIGISTGYLRQLISDTAESCFGVAGLNAYGAKQGVSAMLKKENTTKGVIIRQDGPLYYLVRHGHDLHREGIGLLDVHVIVTRNKRERHGGEQAECQRLED